MARKSYELDKVDIPPPGVGLARASITAIAAFRPSPAYARVGA
jgi:hypothetical protein